MSIAKVEVLHSFPVDGKWLEKGVRFIDAELAARMEAQGYVDIIEVDGAPCVYPACCAAEG